MRRAKVPCTTTRSPTRRSGPAPCRFGHAPRGSEARGASVGRGPARSTAASRDSTRSTVPPSVRSSNSSGGRAPLARRSPSRASSSTAPSPVRVTVPTTISETSSPVRRSAVLMARSKQLHLTAFDDDLAIGDLYVAARTTDAGTPVRHVGSPAVDPVTNLGTVDRDPRPFTRRDMLLFAPDLADGDFRLIGGHSERVV